MVWKLFMAVLAAFGLISIIWAAFGWLLPCCREGWLVYPGRRGKLGFVQIYLWLRGLGVLRCPLILLDLTIGEEERRFLEDKGIEIYSPAELLPRLGIGAEET